MPKKAMRRAELIDGGFTIKQGEIFELGFRFFGYDGKVIIPTIDQTISVKIANDSGVVYETTASVDVDKVVFTVSENIGFGTMKVEIKVEEGTTLIQKYPADGFIELNITKSLDNVSVGQVYAVTAEQMRTEITAIETTAGTALTKAEGAETLSLDTQGQLDAVILRETDSDAMSRQAAVNSLGVDKFNLKQRLDEDYNSVTSTLVDLDVQKASKTELANVLSGSPKGAYATLAALQTAFPTGTPGVYVVSADGHIYSWSGSAWTDRGLYQAVSIADNSIEAIKLTGTDYGKNRLNPETYINELIELNGTLTPAAPTGYKTSGFITAVAESYYTITNGRRIGYYRADESVISVADSNAPTPNSITLLTPIDCAFLRVSVHANTLYSAQVEKGAIKTTFESYKKRITEGMLNHKSVSKEKLTDDLLGYIDKPISPQKTTFIKTGKNLLLTENSSRRTDMTSTTGAEIFYASRDTSEFISTTSGEVLTFTNCTRVVYFDENKMWSGYTPLSTLEPKTHTSLGSYFKVAYENDLRNRAQVEKGNVSTSHEMSYIQTLQDISDSLVMRGELPTIADLEFLSAFVTASTGVITKSSSSDEFGGYRVSRLIKLYAGDKLSAQSRGSSTVALLSKWNYVDGAASWVSTIQPGTSGAVIEAVSYEAVDPVEYVRMTVQTNATDFTPTTYMESFNIERVNVGGTGTGTAYDQHLNTFDDVVFKTIVADSITVDLMYSDAPIPTGTLLNPPVGILSGDTWADTTDSVTHPIVRVMA